MKNLNLVLLFVGMVSFSFGQKIVKVKGDVKTLKGQSSFNIQYDYSEMSVGKYKEEAKYIEDGVAEREKKEAGKGQVFKDGWFGARERVYQPKFETLFNKGGVKAGFSGSSDNAAAKYTLIVKTTFTEPGFNVGVASKPAAINVEYIFVESGTENVVAKLTQAGIPGAQAMGYDFDVSTRVSESYAKAGKMLAAYLAKAFK